MQRTVKITLKNLSKKQLLSIYNGQRESAKVWNECMFLQRLAFKNRTKWPSRNSLHIASNATARENNQYRLYRLHSKTIQGVCRNFIACIEQTKKNRKQDKSRRYPWKRKYFYPLLWDKQAMSFRDNKIILPMGRGRSSIVLDRPEWLTEKTASKILWNGYSYELHLTKVIEGKLLDQAQNTATVDLGQIHLGAVVVENGESAIISGRGIRSEKRELNKFLGVISKKISRCKKHSKRFKKLKIAKNRYRNKLKRKIRDLRHKATRQIVNFCVLNGVNKIFVGNPTGIEKRDTGRKHNQRMSQWEYGKDIQYIKEKASEYGIKCSTGSERGTSSTCPKCQAKQRVRGRNWLCKSCGFSGHRDLVGAMNMQRINFGKEVVLSQVTYLRPNQQWRGSSRCLDTGQPEYRTG